MSAGTPFMFGDAERAALRELRQRANASPVEMRGMAERLATPEGKALHMARMNAQTVELPTAYLVTFSIEHGHPVGTCRHMSMSVHRTGRVPNQFAVSMVADELGFVGGLDACTVWLEDLQGHGKAVNVVQPIMAEEGREQ